MRLRLEVDEGFMFGEDLYFCNAFGVVLSLFDAVHYYDDFFIVNGVALLCVL